jgi:hypothetical protein
LSNTSILLPSGVLVDILLDPAHNSYQFLNAEDQTVVSEGFANSLMNVKKLVRSTLLELGVPLEVEVKNFKKTEEAA